MQIRTNKVLLTILLTALIESKPKTYDGLCSLIDALRWRKGLINEVEYNKLHLYIFKHRPDKENLYSWQPYSKTSRIKWLKQQIKLLQ